MTSLSSRWCSWSRPKLLTHHLRRPLPDPCFFTPRAPVTPPFLVSILFGNNTVLWSLPQSKFFCPATHLLWAFTHSPSNFFSLQGPTDRQDPALAPEPVGICSTCYALGPHHHHERGKHTWCSQRSEAHSHHTRPA